MFNLAATLGMTVRELGDRMGAAELAEWVALLQVEPWGPYRQDYHAAQAAWASVAPWTKEAKLVDFFPSWSESKTKGPGGSEAVEVSPQEARAYLLSLGAVEVPRHG